MSRRRWFPEHIAWLRAAYRLHRQKELPPLFEARFGQPVTVEAIRSAIVHHRLTSGRGPGYAKGERIVSWFPERIEWLREHRPRLQIPALTVAFNAHFGTDFQPHSVANALNRYRIRGETDTRFQPGFIPWNKGLAGYDAGGRSGDTRFQPGQVVWNQMPVWSYRQEPDGYWYFKFRQEAAPCLSRKDWIAVHRLNWEAAHGPLAPGQVVVLLDTDPSHCELDNLACLTRRELVYFNNLNHAVPPDREARRALVARVKLLAAAHGRAEGLGMTPQQRRAVLGVMRRPERVYGQRGAG